MMNQAAAVISDRNRSAADVWGSAGLHYDEISFAISDALAHAAQRMAPSPGAKLCDIATGTGWTARNIARMGAHVTAVDIAPQLLDAARTLAYGIQPPIDFQLADAEALPFDNATFDGVISTFGVMFANDHQRAARELARICAPGGRLVLATWAPDGAVARFFGIISAHSKAPHPVLSPLAWGDPDHVRALLGDAFDLVFERGKSHAYHQDEEAIWAWYLRGFGPLRALHESLDETSRAALKGDIEVYHREYRVDAGLRVDREYLLTIGHRRQP